MDASGTQCTTITLVTAMPEMNTKIVGVKWSQQVKVESKLQVPRLERHFLLALIHAEGPVLLAHRLKSECAIYDTPERKTSSEWQE